MAALLAERYRAETKTCKIGVSVSDIGFLIREAKRIRGTTSVTFKEMSIQDFNGARIPVRLSLTVDFTEGRHHVDVSYVLGRAVTHFPTVSFLERGHRRETSKVILEKQDFTNREDDRRTVSMDALLTRFKTAELLLKLEIHMERVTPIQGSLVHEESSPEAMVSSASMLSPLVGLPPVQEAGNLE